MDIPAHWTAETVDNDGVSLQTYRTGSGPTLLFLHGYFDDGRRWVRLADDLRDDYEVVTLDLRGHGQSDAPESGYAIADRLADIDAVIDQLDLTSPVLVGHSMGATTAGWYAARNDAGLRGVVLIDPESFHELPDMTDDELRAALRQQLDGHADLTIDAVIEDQYADLDRERAERLAEASLAVSEHAIMELALARYPTPLVDQFPAMDCPVLVLRRDADQAVRVRDIEAAEILPDGRLVHLPGAGHYVFQDEYDAALTELRAFLERVDG